MNRPYDEPDNGRPPLPELPDDPTLLDEIRPLLPFLLISVGCPIILILLIPAFGLSLPLLPVLAVLYVLCFLLRKHKNRLLVWILRSIALLATAVYVMLPFSLFLFEQKKAMYPLKCFVYTHGVNSWELEHHLLPDELPEVCEDYLLITQPQGIAQDYYPSLYLAYHTDEQTLRAYEQRLDSELIGKRYENVPHDPEELEGLNEEDLWRMNCPQELPGHVYYRLHITDNLDNAVIYVVNANRYDKGCLLNFETGLVVFWL